MDTETKTFWRKTFEEYCEHPTAIDYIVWSADDHDYLRYRYCADCFDESNLANCEKDGCPLYTIHSEHCLAHEDYRTK